MIKKALVILQLNQEKQTQDIILLIRVKITIVSTIDNQYDYFVAFSIIPFLSSERSFFFPFSSLSFSSLSSFLVSSLFSPFILLCCALPFLKLNLLYGTIQPSLSSFFSSFSSFPLCSLLPPSSYTILSFRVSVPPVLYSLFRFSLLFLIPFLFFPSPSFSSIFFFSPSFNSPLHPFPKTYKRSFKICIIYRWLQIIGYIYVKLEEICPLSHTVEF